MNGLEFLFALLAVTGMTTLHFLWISFVYRIEKSKKEIDQENVIQETI